MRSPFDRIRFERQLILLPILAGVGLLAILCVMAITSHQTRAQLSLLQHGWDESLGTSRDLQDLLNAYTHALQNAAVAAEPAEMERADSVASEFRRVLVQASSNPVVKQAEVDSLSTRFGEYTAFARATTLSLIAGLTTDQLLPDVTHMVDALNELDATLHARTARDKANIIAAYETVERANTRATMFAALALFVVVGVTALLAWSIAHKVRASIDTVGRAASHIAAGDLRTGFDFGSQVQLAPLARPFAAIIDYIRTIANAADRLARGDLSVTVSPRSEQDEVANNLRQAIADRIAMEKSLRESEEVQQAKRMEAIGRLAGGIAHDFNNLLTAIIGHTAMLDEMLGPTHPGHESLVEVKRASDRAASLTRQLLAYGRKQVMHPKLVELDAIVGEVIRMLRPMVREDIAIEHVRSEDLGRVRIDPTQIEQVILNLVLNGRDAMKDGGGTVTISTRNTDVTPELAAATNERVPAGSYVVLEVRDTGVGMDRATQERIFEPFFTTKGLAGGAGLGLATVQGIVRQSGGHVEVRSAPGRGTTFSIYLPREDAAGPSAGDGAGQAEADGQRSGGGELVLVTEDESSVRAMIVRGLVQAGYRVIEAGNGVEAAELADAHHGRIDVLLTDVVMPQMGGRELAARLAPIRPDMKIVFMSGYSEDAVVQPELFDRKHRFIEKPFTPPVLARTIREVLDDRAGQLAGPTETNAREGTPNTTSEDAAPQQRKPHSLMIVLAAAILWPGAIAHAQVQEESPLAIHGFLTQGIARAWSNPVAGAPTGESTLDYRAVALQIGYSFSDIDKLVIQLSHRRLGINILEGSENEVRLDWAFYERRALGEGSVRVGKLPLPRGLFNEIRDVGTALPFYRAPFAIYHESAETFDGASAGYRFFARSPWSLQVEAYGGSYEFDYVRHTPDVSFIETIEARSVHGAVAWLELPVSGTRVGASGHRYRHAGEDDPNWYDMWQLSAETLLDRFTGRAEYVKADSRGYGFEALYVQIGYRLFDSITLNVQKEYADVAVTIPGQALELDYIRDLAGGVAWMVRPNAVLKLEFHDYEGYSLDRYRGFENPPGVASYFIASLAVGF